MQLDGLKVLLAEDNATNRLVARQMLECLGATVAPARDGAEALELVGSGDFDVLLVDVEMPKVSGLEVIRRLAAGARAPDGLTIIGLTAYATPEIRAEMGEAGADGVITKPIVSIEQFGTDIRACIEAKRHRRGKARSAARIDMDIYRGLVAAVPPASLAELIGKVDADISEAYLRMSTAISRGEMGELRLATHNLVAVAGAIGAVGLQSMAQRLNRAAHQRDGAVIASTGRAAAAEAEQVLAFLRDQVQD